MPPGRGQFPTRPQGRGWERGCLHGLRDIVSRMPSPEPHGPLWLVTPGCSCLINLGLPTADAPAPIATRFVVETGKSNWKKTVGEPFLHKMLWSSPSCVPD